MATTYEAIATVEVGAGGASSIQFTSIAADWTDLLLKLSCRSNAGANTHENFVVYFNSANSNRSTRILFGNGSSASSFTQGSPITSFPGNSATANTFGNAEIYIPNYAGSTNKSFSGDLVSENNATNGQASLAAGLWSSTAAITSITIENEQSNNFAQYSTATLYGIKNS